MIFVIIVVIMIALINKYRQSIANQGGVVLPLGNIIHQYDFNGNSNDALGSNNGTDTGVNYLTGLGDNKSVEFSTAPSYVDFPSGMLAGDGNNCTISMLIKSDTNSASSRIFSFDKQHDGYVSVWLNTGANDRVSVTIKTFTNSQTTVVMDSASVMTWNHVTITISQSNEWKVYYNGSLEHTVPVTGNLQFINNVFNVIGSARNHTLNADGQMAALKFWDVILSNDEVNSLSTQELAGIKVN